ncbi:MAG: hypothetical protein M3P92_02235 [Actinomycetota bacterium]|nr:hypothetical protein [Actinomycetota bacterium]
MRRILLLAALAAMLVISAIPVAFAQDRDDRRQDRLEERFGDNGFFFDRDRFDDDGFFFFDGDRFDDDFDNGLGSARTSTRRPRAETLASRSTSPSPGITPTSARASRAWPTPATPRTR